MKTNFVTGLPVEFGRPVLYCGTSGVWGMKRNVQVQLKSKLQLPIIPLSWLGASFSQTNQLEACKETNFEIRVLSYKALNCVLNVKSLSEIFNFYFSRKC